MQPGRVREYENMGFDNATAATLARDYQSRNPWNMAEVFGYSPAKRLRKFASPKIMSSKPVKDAQKAINQTGVGSKLGDHGKRLPVSGIELSKSLAEKVVDKSVNQILETELGALHRDISGLPPALKEQALMELLAKSALGVGEDRLKSYLKGH